MVTRRCNGVGDEGNETEVMRNYIRVVIVVFLIASGSSFVQAQNKTPATTPSYSPEKCTAAFYNRDSVALKMKGFRPWYDSVQHIQLRRQALQQKYFLATDRYLMATPDAGVKMNPQQQSEYNAAKKESETLQEQMSALSDQAARVGAEYMGPYYDSVYRTAVRISRQKNIPTVFEISENRQMPCPTDQMLMIDITNDIATSMGMKPHLLLVGTLNYDSLLRLMPGFAIRADSTLAEMNELNKALAPMDKEISAMQHELDSLRPTLSGRKIAARENAIAAKQDERDTYRGYELYKIDVRDSLRTSPYRKKLRAATASAAKEQNCLKYYDQSIAHDLWTTDEAEFVDLNASIAGKLRL